MYDESKFGKIVKQVPVKRELRTRRLARVEDVGQRGSNLLEIKDGKLQRAGCRTWVKRS